MNNRILGLVLTSLILTCLSASAISVWAQIEQPPEPSARKSVKVPVVVEKKLPNGLTVAVAQKTSTPIVTIRFLVKCGASCETEDKAGLANMTAGMLTKGTKTRTATQIAEEIEFLGGSIWSGADWNSSFVSVTVTSDKVEQGMAILADVVLNPKFDQKELDLLKSQTLDSLTYNLKQPTFLANYVASKYTFDEHPAGGTPESIKSISRNDLIDFSKEHFNPRDSMMIFSGNISPLKATNISWSWFSRWKKIRRQVIIENREVDTSEAKRGKEPQILIIDLPKSGQAAVAYAEKIRAGRIDSCGFLLTNCETSASYYRGAVLNSILGGGYSSRLNYEIRIKRGLSYGAGSGIGWRFGPSNFSTRAQTKNESAPEVAELVLAEIKKLTTSSVANDELVPRKSVLTGAFGRNLETTGGLASALADLYAFGIPTNELNKYVDNVNAVTDKQIKQFAVENLLGGDLIIVGDYALFKDDLVKRFPGMKVEVINADELDLSKDNLRK